MNGTGRDRDDRTVPLDGSRVVRPEGSRGDRGDRGERPPGHRGGTPADVDLTRTPADVDLSRVWTGVAAQVWRREPGWLERTAGRALRSPGLARALVTTPSLLRAWIVATVVVVGAGAVTAARTGQPLVALITPAVAAAGIAYAYGPGIDPAWELSCSMAVSDRMVLLVRTVAVFGLNAALGLAASAASGAAAALTFGWLIPMTAVSALALAVAVVTRSPSTGVAAGLAVWTITVLSSAAAGGGFTSLFTRSALIPPFLLVAACCAAVVAYAIRIPRGHHEH